MQQIHTARLRLEPLRAQHAAVVWEPLQDSALYTYLPDDAPSRSNLQRRYAFLERGLSPDGTQHWLNWVAFLRDSMTPIGSFQATLPKKAPGSFAYIVFPPRWRQGYAREMAQCVLTHLFETHQPPSLYAEIDTRNTGSIRLVESLGLTRVSTTVGADFFKGASSDEYQYSVSREEWLQK